MNIMKFLVERGLVVNLVSLFLIALGLFSVFSINREAFPNVNLDIIQINMVYPGATPEEVERLIITPIEQEIKALSGIDKITSVSFPSSGRIILELDRSAPNRDRIASEVQIAINRANLPQDIPEDPTVLEIDGGVFPIIQLAVSGPFTPLEIKRLGDKLEDDLLKIDGIGRVVKQGDRKAEIRIVVDPKKMRKNRISVGEISSALTNWNVNAPGGEIETAKGQKSVRIEGEFKNAKDVASLMLRANERGGGIRLQDISEVSESLEKPQVYLDVAGKPALNLIVMKKSDSDIIKVVDDVKNYLATIPEKYGAQVRVDHFQDMSRFTRLRLGVLTTNGLVGLALVFICLVLFLRPSVAMTTTWGLPLVFLTGLYFLYISGVTLNLISMLGFIMVLGMIVDDAIIIGENITYHMEKGQPPVQAAVTGALELLGPVTATVMTTVVAFLPMLFMSGMIGKFIVAIPIVVISLLIFSWLESFLVLPSHVAWVTRANKHPKERAWIVGLENAYAYVLDKALTYRWITVLLSLSILIGSLVLAKTSMSFQLFPAVGVDQYLVRVTAPPGITLDKMRATLINMDQEIQNSIKPEYFETTILESGQIAMDSNDALTQRGSRFGQIRVIYTPAIVRPEHDALDDMRKLAKTLPTHYKDLKVAFTELRPGPPTGRALQAEISSYDQPASETAANRLMEYLTTVPGVTSVESGLQQGDDEIHVVLDRALATYAGVNLTTAASHIRAAVGGLRVSSTRRGTEEVDITIRFPNDKTDQMKMLQKLELPNQRGGLVPLSRISRFTEQKGFTTIRHIGGIRNISVLANIDDKIITSIELNALVAKQQEQWLGDVASKVNVKYGGEAEKNQESIIDLMKSFAFAIIGIFFILAIQFNNLRYPLIVMLAIPFGAIGIVISFYLHGIFWKPMPLSFFSMMGMVALTGVVVNSSLVLLVFIQRAIKDGMEQKAAIMLAGRRRLRAVLLTATTTVVGLLPTAYGWGGMDPFVSPMALALSWGLMFATGITLVTIPATFMAASDVGRLLSRKKKLPTNPESKPETQIA